MCYFDQYPEETELIDFNRFGNKGVYGISPDGLCVFVDLYSHVDVEYKDKWLCRIVKNKPTDRFYFAWPIDKVEEIAGSSVAVEEEIEKETENEEVKQISDKEDLIAEMNDTLFSMKFTRKRYSAFRSINGSCLEIIGDNFGNIVCESNRISIEGLDNFLVTDAPHALRYRCQGDRFLVKLEQ